ncbi:hypothetical protein [Streptomyces sp. NPDC057729]|uniref:hypothetical protein n=1 Tax=Streptomyces sp. NPDC057729 TaxID=3346230 RepID=UPI00368F0FA6
MSTNDTPPAIDRFQAGILAALEQYERDRAAETCRDDPGTLDSTRLLTLAQSYARAATPEQRDSLAAEIADRLTINEAGVILRAAATVKTAVPHIVLRAKANNAATAEIARELDMTDSYVRRIVRDYTQYFWRLETYALDDWVTYASGHEVAKTGSANGLAEKIYHATPTPRTYCRVFVWEDEYHHGTAPAGMYQQDEPEPQQ